MNVKNFLREMSTTLKLNDRDELFNKYLEEHKKEVA